MPDTEANKTIKSVANQMIARQYREIKRHKENIDNMRTRLITYLEMHDEPHEIIYETMQYNLMMIEEYKKIQFCHEYITSMYEMILENSSQETEE